MWNEKEKKSKKRLKWEERLCHEGQWSLFLFKPILWIMSAENQNVKHKTESS